MPRERTAKLETGGSGSRTFILRFPGRLDKIKKIDQSYRDGGAVPRNTDGRHENMKRFLKYLAAVMVLAALAYVVYHYRQEIANLALQAKDKYLAMKTKLCAFREEQNDFADL